MIAFFRENTDFAPPSPDELKAWIEYVVTNENRVLGDISYIFTSNDYLLTINKDYLNHDYYTDIVTFDQSSDKLTISGDIFISVDQVRSNAEYYKQSFELELKRVMVHGVLHLIGYNDSTPDEKSEMRKKEEAYLSL